MRVWVNTRFNDQQGFHDVGTSFDWPTSNVEETAAVQELIEKGILSDRPTVAPAPEPAPTENVDEPIVAAPSVEPPKPKRARKRTTTS